MIKNVVRLYDLKPITSNTPAVGTWLRLTRSVSAAFRAMLSWPALAYRERRDMELLGRMSEHELADIGLIRQDLYDMQALPLGLSPTSVLGQRVHQRKNARLHQVTSRPDVATWGVLTVLDTPSYFYRYYAGQGYAALCEELQAPDPFALAPASIVKRILDAGHTPDLERPQRSWFWSFGIVSIVEQNGQRFVVSIDTEGQRISVQEVRSEAHRGSAGGDNFHRQMSGKGAVLPARGGAT